MVHRPRVWGLEERLESCIQTLFRRRINLDARNRHGADIPDQLFRPKEGRRDVTGDSIVGPVDVR